VRGRLRFLAVVLAVLALVAALWWRPDPAGRADPAATAREVAAGLRCPTCAGESAADSAAPAARAMRAVIAERVAAGESPDQIHSYFVDRYGEWILLDPPRQGVGWLLVVLPGAAVVGGVLVVGVLVSRRRPTGRQSLTDADRRRAEDAVAAAADRPGGLTGSGNDERLEAALQLLQDVRSEPHRTARPRAVEEELLAEILHLSSARPADAPGAGAGGGAADDVVRPERRARPAVVVPVVAVAVVCVVALVTVPRALEPAAAGAGQAASAPGAEEGVGSGASADPADELLRQARAFDDAGRFADAVTAYRAVLEERPQDLAAVLSLGFALIRDDRPEEAVPLMEAVLAADPEHPEALLMLGTAEHVLGDDRADTTLRRFLELAPEHPAAAAVRELLDVP
jgi:cytochrome c-type biogenesis protein CcmH